MKAITIMQSDYLPGIFRFEIMSQVQEYLLYDSVPYTQGWRNRNRIRVNCELGWTWLTVPVVNSQARKKEPIQNIKISYQSDWRRKHWQSIVHAYANSRYFDNHRYFFEGLYATNWNLLTDINEYVMKYISNYLGLACKIVRAPKLNTTLPPTEPNLRRVQNLISLCKARHADALVVGPATYNYCQPLISEFTKNAVELRLVNPILKPYRQMYLPFVSGLSMIDLLFNESTETVNEIIGRPVRLSLSNGRPELDNLGVYCHSQKL